jgi:pimeloyl-ACP methyl ester carboxylesterase
MTSRLFTYRATSTFGAMVVAITSAATSDAQQPLPRLERTECFAAIRSWATAVGVECSWLLVPEIRQSPSGKILRLAVARLRAKSPNPATPLVMLHGGPGGVGLIATLTPERFVNAGGTRDLIMYDQRGAGFSEPKLCPEISGDSVLSALPPSQERWDAVARACVGVMRAKGMDPAAYTTVANVADLADLRRALGYRKWDVYGTSYGGRLAFEAMRRDARGTRAVVAESPAVPVLATLTDDPLVVQNSFERVFASCVAHPKCRAAFPTLEQDFYAVYDSLAKSPIVVRVNRANAPTVRLDGDTYLKSMRCQLRDPKKIPRIPLFVRELRRGDRANAAQLLAEDCPSNFPGCFVAGCGVAANPVNPLVNCYDGFGREYWTARASVAARVKPVFRVFEEGGPECQIWQQRFGDSTDLQPVSSDIPTLVLNGEFEEGTPAEHARRGSTGLSHSYLYVIPGESHEIRPSDCKMAIINRFLTDPTRAPDTSCLAAIPKIDFAIKQLAIPTLIFVVHGDAAHPQFDGRWEAEFPAVPRVFTIELKIEGTRVTGVWNPNRLDIFDGTASGDTLRFKVKAPDGQRTITFSGLRNGDELSFTREVEIAPGGTPGGMSVFGTLGARTFTARRVKPVR